MSNPSSQIDPTVAGTSRPTIFHFTHWKAGSQWVRAVLASACPDRVVDPLPRNAHLLERPLVPGAIYSPLYMRRETFAECAASRAEPQARFVVIRDLRDALVSWYFSLKISHQDIPGTRISGLRDALLSRSVEDGLIYLITGDGDFPGLARHAEIQTSWIDSGDVLVRYEDLLSSQHEQFARILRHCGISIESARLNEIVRRHSFEAVSGRPRGEEDIAAHHRKGVPGDWRNHFTPRVARDFKARYGPTLVKTGYESDLSW